MLMTPKGRLLRSPHPRTPSPRKEKNLDTITTEIAEPRRSRGSIARDAALQGTTELPTNNNTSPGMPETALPPLADPPTSY